MSAVGVRTPGPSRLRGKAVGSSADFVVLEGHPLDYRVLPQLVFVDGTLEADRR